MNWQLKKPKEKCCKKDFFKILNINLVRSLLLDHYLIPTKYHRQQDRFYYYWNRFTIQTIYKVLSNSFIIKFIRAIRIQLYIFIVVKGLIEQVMWLEPIKWSISIINWAKFMIRILMCLWDIEVICMAILKMDLCGSAYLLAGR